MVRFPKSSQNGDESPNQQQQMKEAKKMELKRAAEARSLVSVLEKDYEDDPLKTCVMIRVRRLFDVSMANESFTVMLHVVTCWLCEGDAENDAMDQEFVSANSGKFVYDADPDKAFYEPDFRPRIAIRNLCEGAATLDGAAGEDFFFRTYVDGKTLVTWEVEKLCVIGTLFDLKFYPVDVQALDICLELKTSSRESTFVPFPNEATFGDCPAGEVAQVATEKIHLPDYLAIPGHEFSANLYITEPTESWTGEQFCGIKCSCWYQRRHQNDLYNIALAQFSLTTLCASVWTLDSEEDLADRIACQFALILAAVAMKLVVVQTLPPVSYVTLLEKYINYTFFFLALATFMMALERHIRCFWHSHCAKGEADNEMLYIWCISWALFNAFFVFSVRGIQQNEVALVKSLGLTRGPELGAEGASLFQAGGGGISDVRAMLLAKKDHSKNQRKAMKRSNSGRNLSSASMEVENRNELADMNIPT